MALVNLERVVIPPPNCAVVRMEGGIAEVDVFIVPLSWGLGCNGNGGERQQ